MTFRFAIQRHASGQLTGTRLFQIMQMLREVRGDDFFRRFVSPNFLHENVIASEEKVALLWVQLIRLQIHWAYVVYISINLNPTSQVTLTAFWCLEAWWFGSAQLVSRELLLQWKNNRGFSNSSSADGLDVGVKDINMQHIYILYDRSLGPDNWRFLSSRFFKLFMLKSQNTTDFSHQQVVFSSVFSSRLGLGRFSDCQLSLWLHPECHGSWGPWAPGLTTWKLVAPCEYMQMLGEHL